jgi:hypothetical protein
VEEIGNRSFVLVAYFSLINDYQALVILTNDSNLRLGLILAVWLKVS